MARKSKKTKKRKIVELEALKQINLNAAGLDIGAAEIYAAVPEGCGTESVRLMALTFQAAFNCSMRRCRASDLEPFKFG